MAHPVLTYVSQLARKLVMAVLIALLALITYSLWLYVQEHAGYEERREQLLATADAERHELQVRLNEQKKTHEAKTKEMEAQRQRVQMADKALRSLREVEPGRLERVFGDAEQKRNHDAAVQRTTALRAEAQAKVDELRREAEAADQERMLLVKRLGEIQQEERVLKEERFAIQHYLRRAWNDADVLIISVFFVYLFGGLVGALFCYYVWAPLISRRAKPVRLSTKATAAPSVSEGGVVAEDAIWPGEVLWVKKRFLQASDSGLTKRRRFMLNWKRPVACFAAGLTRMIELRNGRSDGERRVVLADTNDPFAELSIVSVPDGGALVLRAGYLQGIIAGMDQPPKIGRHWRVFSWQSWVTGQFGYFEFTGPCRLVVSCVSALETQTVDVRPEDKDPVLRASQAGVVALSPGVEFKPIRSEGFWRYVQRRSPLFDMHLAGTGIVVSRDPNGRGRDRFREQVLKAWGI